jgi:tRNA pseudouridine55 synthase
MYVEPFAAEAMLPLDGVLAGAASGTLPALLPADCALAHLPAVVLEAAQATCLRHGQSLQARASQHPGRCRLYDEQDRFFGIGECRADGLIRPRRILNVAASSAVVTPGVSG